MLPLLHCVPKLNDFRSSGSWDALLLVCPSDLSGVSSDLVQAIQTARILDERLSQTGQAQLIICEQGLGKRLVLSLVGDLQGDCDDVRIWRDAARLAMECALAVGVQRPVLWVTGVPTKAWLGERHQRAREVAALGAMSALWHPLEAREQARGRSLEALALCLEGAEGELGAEGDYADRARAAWSTWLMGVEHGRCLARDVAGTEPERMAPPKVEELCKKVFKDSAVQFEVIKDPTVLLKEYPLLSAVARASMQVKRHQPRVVWLRYEGEGELNRSLYFAGKGVTYDTGGADLKTDGHMAGMSRDKGGAAAVIGFFLTLAQLKPKGIRAVAAIGLVRNSIGSESFVTDEIITSHAGIRVRIGNTDAEGRLVLADLLSHLRVDALSNKTKAILPQLFTVATLTGHAGRAVGPYSICLDNGEAERQGVSAELFDAGERSGDCFERSRLRREDYAFVRPRSLADDVLSCNNEPSSGTARGHQFPMAFLIKAAGLESHGRQSAMPLAYTHLDIGGSGVEGGDWQHGRPTAAPVLAWAEAWLR